jgi:hypothetical protein
MSSTINSRTAARNRKRESRARAAERAAEQAKLLASQHSAYAEVCAPEIVRNPVMSSNGKTMLRGPLVTIEHNMPVRTLAVTDTIKRLARSPRVTDKMIAAARHFQADANDVGTGLGPAGANWGREGVSGGGSGDGRHDAMVMQITIERRLKGAMQALGVHQGAIWRVLVDSIPVSALATETGLDASVMMEFVMDGLGKLVDYYAPRK